MIITVIALTTHELLFARFRRQRGSLQFLDGTRHDCDSPAALAEVLASQAPVYRGSDRFVLVLPPEQLFSRELELPLTDRKKLREVLPLELKGETALESDRLLFDACTLADGRVLALWTRQAPLTELLGQLTELGLEPAIVTVSPTAWHRLVPAGEGTVALWDGSSLAVFQGGRLLAARALNPAEPAADLDRTLAVLELTREVRPERLMGLGLYQSAGAGTPAMPVTPLPVAGELSGAFAGDEQTARELAAVFAVASEASRDTAVDFRRGPLAYTRGRELLRRKLRLTALLAGIFVLLVFAEAGVRWYLVKRDLASVDASIRTIYREVFPKRAKAVDEVAELRAEIKRLAGSSNPAGGLAVLKRLAEAKGDDITGLYDVEVDGEQVRVKGEARSAQAVNDFKARMAARLGSVEVGEIKSKPDGSVSFALRGSGKEAGK
jgi:general secretion pathway protein L